MNTVEKIWAVKKKNDATAEILLYGYIYDGGVNAGDFARELRELEKEYARIDIRISSGGGDVFEGIAIYNAIKRSKAHIETYNDGMAGSMGSIILMAGAVVHMSKNARLMIHQASAGAYGTKGDLLEIAEVLESMNATMTGIYSKKSGKDAAYVKANWMDGKDHYFTADEAKEAGLVDSVYDGEEVEVPAAAKSEKEIWGAFNVKFAAMLNNEQKQNNNSNMKITLSAAIAQQFGFATPEVDVTAIEAKFTELNAAKVKAEADLATLRSTVNKEKIDAIKAQAIAKGVTKEVADQMAEDYKENVEGFEKVVKAMKAYQAVTEQINANAGNEDDDKLVEEWNKMDKKSGALEKLKSGNIERFKQLYKAKFGKEYKA